jgi:hypothetical protein
LLAGTFRVVLLRKRGIVVSAATVRAFGTRFAEVPFVATREGYRREGHCRRLMQVRAAVKQERGMRRGTGSPPACPETGDQRAFCCDFLKCSVVLKLLPLPTQELERVLLGIGVCHVIVPAMRGVLPMWLRKFGYRQFR